MIDRRAPGREFMTEYFVAGGLYLDFEGHEHFTLLGPNPEEPPFLMIDGVKRYFGRLSHHAHLYRVEPDYTLSLVAPSNQALAWGIKAPERVTLDREALKKLQAVMN
jgi:hypothetical protein